MAKKRLSKGKTFRFVVDCSDLYAELKKLNNRLASDLINDLKKDKVGDSVLKNREAALAKTQNVKAPRVREVIGAMKGEVTYSTPGSKKQRKSGKAGKAKIARLELINIKNMDAKTKISVLDSLHPPHHITPNRTLLLKKTKQPKTRLAQNSLWRIFEYKTKSAYKIPSAAKANKSVRYTTSQDAYSKWHVKRSVNWHITNPKKHSSFYILTETRRMYKEDQEKFAKSFLKGVKKIIETKTRFRR